jgi:hypothetical protein
MEKVDYSFDRATVEGAIGSTLTDEQWEVMKNELLDALDYYFSQEAVSLFEQLPEIMAER